MRFKLFFLPFILFVLFSLSACITDKGVILPPIPYSIEVLEGSAQFGCDKMKKSNLVPDKKAGYDLFNETNYNRTLEDLRVVAAGDSYSVLLTQDSAVNVYITPLSTPLKIRYKKNGNETVETIEQNSVLGKMVHFDY